MALANPYHTLRENVATPLLANHLALTGEQPDDMTDLIVKSTVRDTLEGSNVSADFCKALDAEVEELLEDATRRIEVNDRKTVQPHDL